MKKVHFFPVALLLAGSGACALIYQVAWLRELRLVFGCTTSASAAVVAIFMGGLGIGNAVLGKRADSRRNPLAFYALLEAGIAASAAASPALTEAVRSVYIHLGGQTALGVFGATSIRLLLSALILLLPTVLMGGTLAAAAAAATTARDESRRAAAVLYGLNTLGAVAGAMLSTFVMLPAMGTRTTLWCACLFNVLVSVGAYALSRRAAEPQTSTDLTPESLAPSSEPVAEPASRPAAVYFSAAVVGFAFMLMELVWYRMLAPILGGTTFTFGLILSVALLGIGLGGALYPLFFRKRQPGMLALASTCALEAVCFAIPFAMGDQLAIAAAILHEGNTYAFLGEVLGWSAVAAAVVLPASIVSGVQFPVLIAMLGRGDKNVGQQIGWTYAFNTLGSIVGSLAGGLGLLPLLSAPGAWRLVVVTVAGLSVYLALAATPRRLSWSVLLRLGLSAAAVGLLAFTGPTAAWRHSSIGAGRAYLPEERTPNNMHAWQNTKRRSIIWEGDGLEAGVGILSRDDLAFLVNGKSDGAAIADSGTQMCMGLVGSALHPNPKTCLVVGLGTGETGGWLASVPSMERVDIIELEPTVLAMTRRCTAVNGRVLENPKAHIIFNDAREVLLTTSNRYDLVVSEPSNPYRAGIANLFTREFYAAASHRLNPGGLFVQWLQAYETDETTVYTIFATVKSVFKHVEIWQSLDQDVLLLCSNQPFAYGSELLHRRITEEPYRTAFGNSWRAPHLEGFLARYVAGEKLVDEIVRVYSHALNTDDHNQVEYGYARTLGQPSSFTLAELHQRAEEMGAGRPACPIEGVDWDGVLEERMTIYCLRSHDFPEPPNCSKEFSTRIQAFQQFQSQQWKETITQWESQPRQPVYPTETAAIALAYAELGNEKAAPLIEQLRSYNPRESQLLEGILRMRQGHSEIAADVLAAAFVELRNDPFILEEIARSAFRAANALARSNRTYAVKLLDAIKEPFPVLYLDDTRRSAACIMASKIAAEEAAFWIATYEPYVPWEVSFLTRRAQMYRKANHPLADRAEADLELFSRNEPPPEAASEESGEGPSE